jgi:hypothetical protein
MKGYSLIISCVICFVMRCRQGWDCNYNMELTSSQQTTCNSLRNVLLSARGSRGNNETDSGCEEDWYTRLELEGDPLEDPDDDVYEGADDHPVGDSPLAELGGTAWQRIVENPVQACILDILISLYTQLPNGNDDKFFSPLLRFIVLSSLQKNGQWLPPRRITRLFAVLLFCGREVMMALMHRKLLDNPTMRYSQCVIHTKLEHIVLTSRYAGLMERFPLSWTTMVKVLFPRCTSL